MNSRRKCKMPSFFFTWLILKSYWLILKSNFQFNNCTHNRLVIYKNSFKKTSHLSTI